MFCCLCAKGGAGSSPALGLIVLMSLRPAIPRRVALLHCSPPLHQPLVMVNRVAKTVNHHFSRAGEFSTGILRNFQPELTEETAYREAHFRPRIQVSLVTLQNQSSARRSQRSSRLSRGLVASSNARFRACHKLGKRIGRCYTINPASGGLCVPIGQGCSPQQDLERFQVGSQL